MAVPTVIGDLSTTALDNAPSGEDAPSTLDNIQRAHASFIAQLRDEKQAASGKDASGGYAGLTLFKLNLRNAANTFTNFFTNATTAARTWTMPDKDGTVAMTSDVAGKNAIINGGFTVNQRAYASAAVLASGVYGHDRWKAGSGGGDYSFTQLASNTTITIAANKTLIQVIEDKNVHSTSYTLSWIGTALARYAVNSATPAGSYAASPITITGQTAGSTMSIEFGNGASSGTLTSVQLEVGAVATSFERRAYGMELSLCHRYYYRNTSSGGTVFGTARASSTTVATVLIPLPVPMRIAPATLDQTGTAADYTLSGISCSSVPTLNAISNENTGGANFTVAAGLTSGAIYTGLASAISKYIGFSAEL